MPWCRRRYGALKKGWKGNRDGNGFVIRRRGVILEELAPVDLLAHEHEKWQACLSCWMLLTTSGVRIR